MPTDTERLDFLEEQVKRSPSGVSFDKIPSVDGERSGYRFMTRHNIREARGDIRKAIDSAMAERQP